MKQPKSAKPYKKPIWHFFAKSAIIVVGSIIILSYMVEE